MQEELFVRLRRSIDRILDDRAGERAAPTLAYSCNGRGVRLRIRRKPPEARLRRPLPQRRAARRPRHAHRDRGHPPSNLATRDVRAGPVRRPRDPLAASGRVRPPRGVILIASARRLTTNGPTSLLLLLEETSWRRRQSSAGGGGGSGSYSAPAFSSIISTE